MPDQNSGHLCSSGWDGQVKIGLIHWITSKLRAIADIIVVPNSVIFALLKFWPCKNNPVLMPISYCGKGRDLRNTCGVHN